LIIKTKEELQISYFESQAALKKSLVTLDNRFRNINEISEMVKADHA